MGVFEGLNEHGRSWLMPPDNASATLAVTYRKSANKLRELAAEVRFDFGRRGQLLSLADAFDRLAARLEGSPAKRAAD
jgi:hypothetical protein